MPTKNIPYIHTCWLVSLAILEIEFSLSLEGQGLKSVILRLFAHQAVITAGLFDIAYFLLNRYQCFTITGTTDSQRSPITPHKGVYQEVVYAKGNSFS